MEKKEAASHVSLGLALGGGATRGVAHIGVLKALEEQNINLNYLTGTSIGAIIAALYAFGRTPEEIRDISIKLKLFDYSNFTLSKYGLLSNEEMGSSMRKFIGDVNLEDATTPLAIIAADISSGEKIVFKEGNVADAVTASTCVPGIFKPYTLGQRMLVDGGIVENIPISPLKDMGADVIIGVDLNNGGEYHKPEGLVEVLLNAFAIAIDNTTRMQTKKADILIRPPLSDYSRTASDKMWELYAEGYRSTMLAMPEIRELMQSAKPSSLELLEKKFRAWRES